MPATKHTYIRSQRLADKGDDTSSTQQVVSRVLDTLPSHHTRAPTATTHVSGVLIGWLVGIDVNGTPMVIVPDMLPEPRPATALCPLTADHVGAQCAVMFGGGNLASPILMGMLHHPVLAFSQTGAAQVTDDAEGLHIQHRKEIALHCGKASLRLTRDGRIELRGTTLVSHATGLNRVRGASVKLN